jgi:hypothetical protein
MKSVARFSAWIGLAAILSCAPLAFGQSAVNANASHRGNIVLSYSPATVVVAAFEPHADHIDRGHGRNGSHGDDWGGGGNGDGCGNQGGNGNGGWGNGGWGWGGGSGGGCPVPEGGNALTYLLLAGLCCAGAVAFRLRRPVPVQETN